MNILHVLSYSPQPTGSWFYARDIAMESVKRGHKVYFCADVEQVACGAEFYTLPIGIRNMKQRVKNIMELRRIIRDRDINVLHAHSRAASWVCFFATRFTKTALVSTIHGRQHRHASMLFNIYGDEIIAISRMIYDQLTGEFRYDAGKVSLIPNGIRFTPVSSGGGGSYDVSIIGRTSGPKGQTLRGLVFAAFHELLRRNPLVRLNLVGGEMMALGADAVDYINRLNEEFQNRISCYGFVPDISRFLGSSRVVIGAGRVAIEALHSNTPVIAVGEAEYVGLITDQNFENAAATNFGDIKPAAKPVISADRIISDIEDAEKQKYDFRPRVEEIYGIDTIFKRVEDKYKKARMRRLCPRHIPALMYHRVTLNDMETKNKIYITDKTLKSHLNMLDIMGYTPITFEIYDKYRDGILPEESFPKRPVFLTFDDGYQDNYSLLFPLLKKHGFVCTIFALGQRDIRTNFWDADDTAPQTGLLTDDQIVEMSAYGIEFGSHSLSHPRLPALAVADAEREIIESKRNLEGLLGKPVISFCYPYGDINNSIKEIVKAAGYKYGIATDSGGMHIEDDLLQIFRAYIFPQDGRISFFRKSASWYRGYYFRKRGK